jgi:hypothetical protein
MKESSLKIALCVALGIVVLAFTTVVSAEAVKVEGMIISSDDQGITVTVWRWCRDDVRLGR